MFVRACAVFQSTHRSREWNLYLKCVFCDLVIISIVIIIHPGTVAYTLHAIAWWALRRWIKPKPGVILYLQGKHRAVCSWREKKAALLPPVRGSTARREHDSGTAGVWSI